MGFAASAGAFSALTAKGTPGMCSASLQAGAVDFSPHPTLPTLAGEWEGAPHHSQPAVKGILKDKEEKNNRALLGSSCSSSCTGFGDTVSSQSWRRHHWCKSFGAEVRCGSSQGAQCCFISFTSNPNFLNLPAKLTAPLTSCKLQAPFLSNLLCPFPFPHQICFQGDAPQPWHCPSTALNPAQAAPCEEQRRFMAVCLQTFKSTTVIYGRFPFPVSRAGAGGKFCVSCCGCVHTALGC